jgi:hypothetical protein
MDSDEREFKACSRRDLLVGAGKLSMAGGLMAASAGGLGLLAGCGNNEAEEVTQEDIQSAELPWPYAKIEGANLKQVQETAHKDWFTGYCAYATLSSIVKQLRQKIGAPYNGFPMEVITFGHGGTAGWGGTCGTLAGAGMAASLAAGAQDGERILNEVMKWYTDTELPIYVPDEPKAVIRTVSRSNSPLCHISVGKWMSREGVGFASAGQMERCARLSADVAARTVQQLNSLADGTFADLEKSPVAANGMPSQYNCTDCHGDNVPAVPTPGGGESLIERSENA